MNTNLHPEASPGPNHVADGTQSQKVIPDAYTLSFNERNDKQLGNGSLRDQRDYEPGR